jgi:mannose-6-phosphate isomerase-like protein (cupin superfamily)
LKTKYDITQDHLAEWLGTDSPPSQQDIEAMEDVMNQFASSHAMIPDTHLKNKILEKIQTLQYQRTHRTSLQLSQLPLLDASANVSDWQEVVKEFTPPATFEGIHLHTLESNDKRDLFVAWVKEYVEEEVHFDLVESFLLLEGTCECHITNDVGETRVIRMGVGDFITMPLGETHDIVITSLQPAKAILQWMKQSA